MNDNKVKIFEYLDTLVKMCRSKGNGASLVVEEQEITDKINEYDLEIEEINNSITVDCYDASAEMADRNIEIITKKLIQQLKSKLKEKRKELNDYKAREEDYSSQMQILRENKKSYDNYISSLEKRLSSATDQNVKEKYEFSIQSTSEKLSKVSKELENKNLEYVILQKSIEELSDEILKIEENLTKKERLLAETQDNLKLKESYLDQTKIDKNKNKINELESKKKKLFDRLADIKDNCQYLASIIKDNINEEKDSTSYRDNLINLLNQAHRVPYMNVDANKLLEEELLKATQERDSFALEIDQKNYSLLETVNPAKIRIDYLKDRIEKWNIEKEEIKDKILAIDNDQKYNYQEKYDSLNNLLDNMKYELDEFEKAYDANDDINLTSKSSLKLSIEEKKQEIFEAEKIMSLFRKDESDEILFANDLYTHEYKKLEDKIESANQEIENIKSNMVARKSGLIDIATQNRDKDKLKELAVKVIDIKHRRQFADKPIEIARELEILLGIELIPYLELIVEPMLEPELTDIKIIVGDSSVDLNIENDLKELPKEEIRTFRLDLYRNKNDEVEEQINDDSKEEELEEKNSEEFTLVIPPVRGIKVIDQSEIDEYESAEESEINSEEIVQEDSEVELAPVYNTENNIIEEKEETQVEEPTEEVIPQKELTLEENNSDDTVTNDDIITLSNEDIEPEDIIIQPNVVEETEIAQTIEPIQLDEEMTNSDIDVETTSQAVVNDDNIMLDNELSQELDQYLNDLDLPNT